MAGANNWRQPTTGPDWMREVEKRILHEERRPVFRTSSDLLGPGIAPYSILVGDWNADETAFNGLFHSEPDALNAPIADRYWMGISQGTADGFGLQRVSEYRGYPTETAWPRPAYVRKFFTGLGLQRQFSAWQVEDGSPVGVIAQYGANVQAITNDPSAWDASTGWTIDRQETRVVADNLLATDVEATRTGAAIAITTSGDVVNTSVATLNVDYTVLPGQSALASGQDGRAAHFNLSASGDIQLASIGGTTALAIGETVSFGGIIAARSNLLPFTVAPNGWLVCDGTLRDIVDYPDLFGVIGVLYNTGGEEVDQFRLPVLAGKVIKA